MGKHKATILLEHQITVAVNGLNKWWPLTIRQVFYQLVSKHEIENTKNAYNKISTRLSKMRREELIPWEAITDKTRRVIDKKGITNIQAFVAQEMKYLFLQYNRCLVQQQENYVELWTEKEALASIFEFVAWPFCVRVVPTRGQLSATVLHDYAIRATAAIDKGQHPVIVYGGDLDPTGVQIPRSIQRGLKEHHDVEVKVDNFALTPQQVKHYNLPAKFNTAKVSDSNYEKFVKQYHTTIAVELDALPPDDLTDLIKTALHKYLDVQAMAAEMDIQEKERHEANRLRRKVINLLRKEGYDIPD